MRPARCGCSRRGATRGRLVVWPDPVVCYAGSAYRQRQAFDVHATVDLVLVDWMTSGRRESGERWRFRRYDNCVAVRVDGREVLRDAVTLSPDEGDLAARMGRFDVVGAVTMVGPAAGADGRRVVGELAGRPFARHPDLLVAGARLGEAGAILRVAGRSVEAVGRVLAHHLAFVAALLGDDPWARKW